MAATPKPMRKKLREGTNIARKKMTEMEPNKHKRTVKGKRSMESHTGASKNFMKMIKEVY